MNITYRNSAPSEALNQTIEKRFERLQSHFHRIDRCDVVIHAPTEGHRGPSQFECHLELHVPGKTISVSKHPQPDAYATVHAAFDAAERQLEHHARR